MESESHLEVIIGKAGMVPIAEAPKQFPEMRVPFKLKLKLE